MTKGSTVENAKPCVFSDYNFFSEFIRDLESAKSLVLIQSPFLAEKRVDFLTPYLKPCIVRGIRVCTFARIPTQRDLDTSTPDELKSRKEARNKLIALGAHFTLRRKGIEASSRSGLLGLNISRENAQGAIMNDTTVAKQIEGAKDSLGVITASALHNQLNKLTPDDWREAAALYSKGAAGAEGFYIDDDAAGKVTIHNDLTKAHKLADNSVWSATEDDIDTIGHYAFDGTMAVTAGTGVVAAVVGATSGMGLVDAVTLGIGAGAEILIPASLVAGAVGSVAVGVDQVRNYYRKSLAEQDVNTAPQLTFQSN
jgi:hypothetical protein